MYKDGLNKLETGVQILKLFQGANLVLLTETWHFPGCDSLVVACTMQLGKINVIKHSGGVVVYFRSHLNPNLSQWKEGSHDFYLWIRVSRGAAIDLFVCVVYAALIGSKHESESLFQNLAIHIVEVQNSKGHNTIGRGFLCMYYSATRYH